MRCATEGGGKYAQYGRFVDISKTDEAGSSLVNLKVDTPEGTQASLAMLDLGKLGSRVKSQRRKGKLNKVFVLGQNPIPPPGSPDSLAGMDVEMEN